MFRRVENLRMWARNTFHGWFLRSPHGFERKKREGGCNGWKKNSNPSPWSRGLYSPAAFIGSTNGASVLPAVPENVTERSYRYTDPGPVLPGGSGSTDTASVLPRIARNSNRELISVLPTLCRLYRQIK
jgi:hypothetical protein